MKSDIRKKENTFKNYCPLEDCIMSIYKMNSSFGRRQILGVRPLNGEPVSRKAMGNIVCCLVIPSLVQCLVTVSLLDKNKGQSPESLIAYQYIPNPFCLYFSHFNLYKIEK